MVFTSATEQAKLILSRFLKKELELNELKQEIIEDYNQLEDGRFMVDEMHRPVLKFSKNLPELLFYVFPNEDGSMWMIKTTNIDGSKFESRCSLPAEWAGKNGAELEEVSGIEGFDFCHNSLFICGASSKEAILKALEKSSTCLNLIRLTLGQASVPLRLERDDLSRYSYGII
jgi:uncharacterized UPF0160 family protein